MTRNGISRLRIPTRLGLWPCLAFFTVAALFLSCDEGPTGEGGLDRDFVYLAGFESIRPNIQKYDVKTGEFVWGFTPLNSCVSAEVDPEFGHIFVHTGDYIRCYSNEGRPLYEVRVQSYRESGREYIALDSRNRILCFLDGLGRITVLAADGFGVMDRFETRMLDAHQFYMAEGTGRFWMVSKDRHEIRGYRVLSPRTVTFAKSDGKFWQIAFEPRSDTIIVGYTKVDGHFLLRFGDYPVHTERLPVDIFPKYVAVEPGPGTLWVSDGEATERYAPDGEKLAGFPDFGFKYMVFNYSGRAAFAVDPNGAFFAVNARELKPIWAGRRFSPGHDIHMLRYMPR